MANIQKPSYIAANRNVFIAGSVLLFHALAIWALQTGLLMRAVEIIVPVQVLAQIIDAPAPKTVPSVPAPPMPVKLAVTKPTPVTQTSPPILTVNEAAPTAAAFVAPAPQPPSPMVAPSVPLAATLMPSAAPAPAKVILPSSDADYLKNPKAKYPRASHAMREEGTAQLEVLIGANGMPQEVKLSKSSGYERLDNAALDVVKTWRFVPGTVNGVSTAMSRIVPYTFKIVD